MSVVAIQLSAAMTLNLIRDVRSRSLTPISPPRDTLDFQLTSDTDGIVTFETWDDFRDTHGHDPGVVCRRAFCDGGVQHQFMSPVPRLRNASMQSPCDMHPACASIQARMNCLGNKCGVSWRYLQAAFGGSLAGCFIGWTGFGNYAFCVGRG